MKVSKFITGFLLVFILACPVSALTIYDSADLLTPEEEVALTQMFSSADLEYEVGIYTMGNYTGQSFFDYMKKESPNYFGTNRIVFAVAMDSRHVMIETNGIAELYFRNEHTDSLRSQVSTHLSNDDVYAAATLFSRYVLVPPDPISVIEEKGGTLLVSFLLSLVIAAGVTYMFASKMNTVRAQDSATGYIDKDEFKLTHNREIFLYRNIIKTPRPKSNSSGGGGGGGRSRGGSAGRF